MAIVFESKTTKEQFGGSSLVLTKPSGTVDGDLLIFVHHADANLFTGDPKITGGWTDIWVYRLHYQIIRTNFAIRYRFASGEPSSYTVSWLPGNDYHHDSAIFRFSGVNTYGAVTNSTEGADVTPDLGSITTDEDNCLVFAVGLSWSLGTSETVDTLPTDYTDVWTPTPSNKASLSCVYMIQPTAATVSGKSWTMSAAPEASATSHFWFRPLASGGGFKSINSPF